ncbi:hypothetical protein [Caulobacter sp. RHG1]|uniref:hypothetical protein n=1 Tax=Caulobacter sp. (strain RHG1) TaxID=2545762 RepID=UPI0015526403|nr:hypothetical protein [Caulobacter sp. RHG1]
MKKLGHEVELADEQEVAEFRNSFAKVGEDQKRILTALIARLMALQEHDDTDAALRLVDQVRRTLVAKAAPLH